MNASELDYDLPAGADRAAARSSGATTRGCSSTRARAARCATASSASCPTSCRRRRSTVVNDTRVVPARIRIERPRGEVLLLERLGGRRVGGARAADAPAAGRAARTAPVELLEHLGEGRWRLRLDGEPAGEAPLPPYITEPLADPERYQTVYADGGGLGRRADRRAALHARSCSRGSTSSA